MKDVPNVNKGHPTSKSSATLLATYKYTILGQVFQNRMILACFESDRICQRQIKIINIFSIGKKCRRHQKGNESKGLGVFSEKP